MFYLFFIYFFINLAGGNTPPDNTKQLEQSVEEISEPSNAEIVVEAHRDIEIFVAPIKVLNLTTMPIESVIDENAAFAYSARYARVHTKVSNGHGGFEPISLADYDVMVYNSKTIKYAWDNCNYEIDALKCAVENSHYFLETIVHVDDNQLVIRTTLYDQYAQVINTSSRSDNKTVRWIKQQEITVQQQQGLLGNSTTIHKPKEELPLKWEIPHQLTDKMVQQVILGLWVGLKLE